jgi:methyl-accepting chemotaxis protein
MEERIKRRRFPIVDRSLQYRFLALVLAYGLITIFILAVSLFLPDIINMNDEDLSMELRGAAADRILTLHMRVWPAVVAVICIFGLHSFRTFHRIIGPLYRFRWAFDKIRKGDLNFRVRLRTKDYLNKEEELFNEMIDAIAGKWRDIQSTSEQALKSLDTLEKSEGEIRGRRLLPQRLLKTHRKHLETLLSESQYFRLEIEEKKVQNKPDSEF